MQKRMLVFGVSVLALFSSFVSAFSFGGYFGNSPIDFLANDLNVRFFLFWALFFVIIYYSLSNSRMGGDGNRGIAVAIAGIVSLLIAIVMLQRGLLYGYLGDTLGDWILLIGMLLVVVFIFGIAFNWTGPPGVALSILVIWFALYNTDPYTLVSYGSTFDFLASWQNYFVNNFWITSWEFGNFWQRYIASYGAGLSIIVAVIGYGIAKYAAKKLKRRRP